MLPFQWPHDGENRSVVLAGVAQPVADGWLEWPINNERVATPEHRLRAEFSVLRGLISEGETVSITSMLKELEFDADADTVDGMSTHEFYLERHGGYSATHLSSLTEKPDVDERVRQGRQPVRDALAAITRPIVVDRITPWVRARYAEQCARGGGRDCTPCFSLVRRYLPGERRAHPMHFDIQALVTVVISLSSHGADYHGGLYVSAGEEPRLLPLMRGDAVSHQSDLLHGVNVTAGERWSWVLWYKDSGTCAEHGHEWQHAAAADGDPVAQFLHAQRVHLAGAAGGGPPAKAAWLQRAADGGFGRAMNELGQMYKLGQGVGVDRAEAARLFEAAIATSNETDALFVRLAGSEPAGSKPAESEATRSEATRPRATRRENACVRATPFGLMLRCAGSG